MKIKSETDHELPTHQPVCFGIGMDWALPMALHLLMYRLNKPFDGTEQQQLFL